MPEALLKGNAEENHAIIMTLHGVSHNKIGLCYYNLHQDETVCKSVIHIWLQEIIRNKMIMIYCNV